MQIVPAIILQQKSLIESKICVKSPAGFILIRSKARLRRVSIEPIYSKMLLETGGNMQITEQKSRVVNKTHTTLAGLLLSALDMEDDLAHSVYQEYLERASWPEGVDEGIIESIQEKLSVLLKDTKKHRNILTFIKLKLDRHG